MPPVAVRAAPAARKNSEQEFLDLRSGAIAQSCQVRNQACVPKQNRDSEVSRNCKHVTYQWAAEIWPNAIVVWQRCKVPRHPDAAHMHAGENCCANDREKRHRFRGTID